MTPKQFTRARKRLGFTSKQLADEWGMGTDSRKTIERWESGERPMNPIAAYCLRMMVKRKGDAT